MNTMSLIDLADMYIFFEVASSQTLTAAAVKLDIPLSSLSRRIASYEKRLGLRLVDRSTRRLKLTEVGERYFQRTRTIILDARAAHGDLSRENDSLDGNVTLAVLSDSEVVAVAEALVGFSREYKDVKVDIRLIGSLDQLELTNADCALHSGQGSTQNYISRHLRSLPSVLVVHPSLAPTFRLGEGDTVCGRLISCERRSDLAMVHRQSRRTRTVSFRDVLLVEHQSTVMSAILAGFGAAALPYEVAARYLAEGVRAEVGGAWEPMATDLFLTYKSRLLPLRARLLIEWLCKFPYVDRVGSPPPVPAPKAVARTPMAA